MRLSWKNVWIILWSDIRQSFRSKGLIFFLALPVILSLIMNLVTRQPSISSSDIVILGESQGAFAQALKEIEADGITLFNVVEMSESEAMDKLERGKISAVIEIPQGTSAALLAGEQVQINVTTDESSPNTSMIIQSTLREMARAFSGIVEPMQLNVKPVRSISSSQAMLPTWIVMALMSGLTLLPATIASERQLKTLDALLITPASFLDIVVGKAAYGVVLSLFGSLVIMVVNGSMVGNLALAWLYILLGAVMASFLGALIGVAVKDLQAASSVSTVAYIFLLWGMWFSELPGVIGTISKYTPAYFIADGIRNALFTTTPISEHITGLVYIGAIIVASLILSIIALRRQDA
ncbi:MAG: ABC transporter permease [Bacillota bacterium]|jgi:ABC-2 type transport system permease protein